MSDSEKKCLMLLVGLSDDRDGGLQLFVRCNQFRRALCHQSFEFSSVNGQLRLGAVQRFLDLFAFADLLLQEGVVRVVVIEESLDFQMLQADFEHVVNSDQYLCEIERFADEILRSGFQRAQLVPR